jgi:hypothetical protein
VFDTVVDDCGVCGGDGTDCTGEWDGDACTMPANSLYLTADGSVLYNSSNAIGGFQFDVEGATILDGSGGDSGAAGFVVSSGGSTILGFSFSGASFGPGCGTIVYLDLNDDATGLSGIVMSDPTGNVIDFTYYEGGVIEDVCDDESACNTGEEGDCEYSEYNYDCAGNCIVNLDCLGVCGGIAVVDECGVCGGDGIADGTCDCDGNVLDCSGECGGIAVVDECGECGGSGPSLECENGNLVCNSSQCNGCDTELDECGVCGGSGPLLECENGDIVCYDSQCNDCDGWTSPPYGPICQWQSLH